MSRPFGQTRRTRGLAAYRPGADACQRLLLPRVAVACFFHVYGYRPFLRHTPPSLILALDYAQKLSPSINVELVGGLEVFRHHADRIVSQPPLAVH
jgi:hypothetical protein